MKRTCINFVLIFQLFFLSCKRSAEIVAEAGGQKVYLDEVDNLVGNSLHEYLSAIYETRAIAADEIINMKLLQLEAQARNISVDSLLAAETRKLAETTTLKQYIADNSLQAGVVDEANPFVLLPLHSTEGKRILKNSYEKHLKIQFLGALRDKHGVKFLLKKPVSPKVDLRGIQVYTRGNVNSKNTITIVSNFNCAVCRRKAPDFKMLYERYRDSFRFNTILLSSSVTLPVLLATCAAKQNKFWQTYDLLYDSAIADSLDLIERSRQWGLNDDCLLCLKSGEVKSAITDNMNKLRALGLNATPTIIINDHIYYGSLDDEAIRRFMKD
ncbi:thioredoxin domain-containing protein [Dyadobacter sandarakinus]|uniref:Thioredoxin domain-containing protein n=1 Tax=Dyadobacter sandarakinus TaxID=2747268 RepID=A0ABX7IBW9_9BACT|nr:thioredoxin domain-containing protein [Dyadobacter sandarakinus]QRR03434.1 thioredoxin domain-containing protein [Dyadobacter sandarakinus]